MRGTRKFGTILLLAALAAGGRAAAQTDAALTNGWLDAAAVIRQAADVTRERYPDADMVIVDDSERVRYAPDGTSDSWDDCFLKVLTEKGKRDEKTQSFSFNAFYDEVEVPRMDILHPDGTSTPVDVPGQSRVSVSSGQMASNIYDPNQKVLRVSVPDLEIGDTLRYVFHRRTKRVRMPDTWTDYTVFESQNPILHATYEVLAPAERPLAHHLVKAELPGTIAYEATETPEGTRHRWEVHDVPRMFSEPNMPPWYTVVQRLLVGTIPDWQTISRWYWTLSKPHLEAVTPGMRSAVAELTRDAPTRQAKVEALFRFVSQQVRYMGITTEAEAPGYEPHDVSVTFGNRYGVCRDKAALLVALLRLADIEAFPVLIQVGPKKDGEVPQPYFNHAIVASREPDGSYQLMDPTDESARELLPAYLCNRSYLVATPKGETLLTSPIVPAAQNLLHVETTGRYGPGGSLEAETRIRFDGINDNAYRGFFSRRKPEERRRYFEGLVKRVAPGARLTSFALTPDDVRDTSQPLSAVLRFETPSAWIAGDPVTLVPPPWFGTSVGVANFVLGQTGLKKRKYPFVTEIACGVEESFRLDYGDALGAVRSVPAFEPIDTPTVGWTQQLTAGQGLLAGSGRFLLKTVEFSPEQYLALKDDLKVIEYNHRKMPVFRTAGVPGAEAAPDQPDARILEDDVAIEVEDAHAWTLTQHVRKAILTYAGVKQNSELKLGYNPAWETAELVSARVVGADGAVKEVSPQEINLMDAGWAGGAPRYPAGKTLVVSLPGVEISGTVEYTIKRRQWDRPFLSTAVLFGAFEPIDRKHVTLSVPDGIALQVADRTGGAVAATRRADGDRTVYDWLAEARPARPKEDGLPPPWVDQPNVLLSLGDWATYAALVRQKLEDAARGQPAARAAAAAAVGSAGNEVDRARAIRDFVARRIRPAGPSFDDLPLSTVTPADTTLSDGYGDSADRAVLLATMLRAAGFDARFVLCSSSTGVDAVSGPFVANPQRSLFDGVLVAVEVAGERVYLNDTDQYASLGATPHDGQPSLDLAAGAPGTVHAAPARRTRVDTDYEIALDDDGAARIAVTRRFYGGAFGSFHRRFAEMPPEERRRHYQEMVAAVSQSAEADGDLETDYDVYPGVERFAVKVDRYAVRDGARLYCSLPGADGNVLNLRADTRQGPMLWAKASRSLVRYRVIPPGDLPRAELAPPDVSWNAPADAGRIRFATAERSAEGAPLELSQEIDRKPALIPADDYENLTRANRRLSHPRMRTLLFTAPEPAGVPAAPAPAGEVAAPAPTAP